jgi:tRNA A37 methylthiotransferase MiaB
MSGQVSTHIARERSRILRDLASQKKMDFMNTFVGKRVEAITVTTAESAAESGYTQGLTDNYLPMRLTGNHPPNFWLFAKVEKVADGALVASASPEPTSLQ